MIEADREKLKKARLLLCEVSFDNAQNSPDLWRTLEDMTGNIEAILLLTKEDNGN